MMAKLLISSLLLLMCSIHIDAQTITYSSPDDEDIRTNNFEIVGKINGQVIIYKNSRNYGFFNIYNNDMKVIAKRAIPNLPADILSTNFIAYPNGFLMYYQYQKRDILYLKLLHFNTEAQLVGDVQDIDTDMVEGSSDIRTYKLVISENKQSMMAFKLSKKDKKQYGFKSILLNKVGAIQHKSTGLINTNGKNEFFSEFMLDNEGNFSCLWLTGTNQNDNINSVTILEKKVTEDTIRFCPVPFNGIYLDDVKMKIDNVNHHYLVSSFYSKQKKGNVDGLFFFMSDIYTLQSVTMKNVIFSDEMRYEAKGDNSVKMAFNDYFLKNIIFNQSGGFLILTESEYSSSKNNTYNRWDYLNNSPSWSNYDYNYGIYSPISGYRNNVTRYFSDNIVLMSFDETGGLLWSNMVRKSQFDDISENNISYGMANTGDELHFIFNIHERNTVLLSQASVNTEGKLIFNNSPMKSLDKGFDFLPRLSKQIGKKQMIVPCLYGNITCFAKIEF